MIRKATKTRGRPRSFDRERVVSQAMNNYWEAGFHRSVNEVCRRAGLSKPALYREFGGEDQLMAAALAHYRKVRVVPLLSRLVEERPFADTLEGAIVGLSSDDGTPAGCLFTKMRVSKSRLGEETLSALTELEREHRDAYEALFRRALARGDGNPEISPTLAARHLDTQLACVLVQCGLGADVELVRAQARLALSTLSR